MISAVGPLESAHRDAVLTLVVLRYDQRPVPPACDAPGIPGPLGMKKFSTLNLMVSPLCQKYASS